MDSPADAVIRAIMAAEGSRHHKLPDSIFDLEGMSSRKVRILLNEICADAVSYLEIGTWKGSTLISASYGNACECTGVDNFSQFQGKIARTTLFEKLPHNKNCRVIEGDYLNGDTTSTVSDRSYDVLFVDGYHSEKDTAFLLEEYSKLLNDKSIIILDDWSWKSVKDGAADFLEKHGKKIAIKIELPGMNNADPRYYWNGLCVLVMQ